MKVNHLMKNWAKGKYRIEMVVNKSKEAIQCIDVDDHCIIHGKEDGAVELIDLEDSMRCVSLQNPTGIAATNIKIQGEQVFVAFINGELKLFDFDGVLVLEYRGCTENHDILTTNAFRVISVVASRQILIWNINSSELLHKLNIHEEDIEMIAIYNDMIMTSDWNKKLILTDIKTGANIHDIFTEGEILCCKFDYKIVVTGSSESLVKLWFTTDMVPMFTMSGHEAEIYCVTYNDDIVISGSADSTIRIWSMFGICQMVLNGHIGVVRALHLDQFKLVSYGDQTRIIIWDCKKFKKLEVLYRNPYLISKFFVNFKHITTLSPDSQITKFSYW